MSPYDSSYDSSSYWPSSYYNPEPDMSRRGYYDRQSYSYGSPYRQGMGSSIYGASYPYGDSSLAYRSSGYGYSSSPYSYYDGYMSDPYQGGW